MNLEVRRYTPGDRRAWDEFVGASNNGHFMHRRGYLEYHGDRLEDDSLLFRRGDALLALLPAHRRGALLSSHGGLTFGGLITRQRAHLETIREIFDALVRYMSDTGLRRLDYRPAPFCYQHRPAEEDQWCLERLGARVTHVKVGSVLPRGDAFDAPKERRRQARLAKKAGVRVARSKEFGAFMALLEDVLASRHGATPVHTPAEMELLASRFPEEIVLYTAQRDGELLGGSILYRDPRCAKLQYTASGRPGRECSVSDALDVRMLSAADSPWLDLGTSMIPDSGEVSTSLLFRKEAYGARAVLHRTWTLDLDDTSVNR